MRLLATPTSTYAGFDTVEAAQSTQTLQNPPISPPVPLSGTESTFNDPSAVMLANVGVTTEFVDAAPLVHVAERSNRKARTLVDKARPLPVSEIEDDELFPKTVAVKSLT